MKDLNQQILNFNIDKNLTNEDYYISKSNSHILDLFDKWPKWEKNFLNIIGDKFSGKTHLCNIFLKKFRGIKINASSLNNNDLKNIKIYENVVLEDLNENIDQSLFFTLLNIIEQDNKYLVASTIKPIVEFRFDLPDLRSRSKNFLLMSIEKPDDELIYALILKNLSDRQITLDKKLINYIIKRIDRSYSKIFEFIYKIDEMSLKKKKSINLKIIKEALGE